MPPVEKEPRLADTSLTAVSGLALSDDGRRLAFSQGGGVAVWDFAGAQPRKWPAVKLSAGEPWRFTATAQSGRRARRA